MRCRRDSRYACRALTPVRPRNRLDSQNDSRRGSKRVTVGFRRSHWSRVRGSPRAGQSRCASPCPEGTCDLFFERRTGWPERRQAARCLGHCDQFSGTTPTVGRRIVSPGMAHLGPVKQNLSVPQPASGSPNVAGLSANGRSVSQVFS